MGCISGYCSNGLNFFISKDKKSTTVVSNVLINPVYSNKNKLLKVNTVKEQKRKNVLKKIPMTKKKSLSFKEGKIPDNPLPFVKIKPKKILY